MNKARHDLETKMTDEIERNRSLQDIVRLKEEMIQKKQQEMEDLDKRVIDLERNIEAVEIKKAGSERQFEL
jgi:predicted  nucleic acid-binding Zn-ribbon protein